jgi:hypothetical protein
LHGDGARCHRRAARACARCPCVDRWPEINRVLDGDGLRYRDLLSIAGWAGEHAGSACAGPHLERGGVLQWTWRETLVGPTHIVVRRRSESRTPARTRGHMYMKCRSRPKDTFGYGYGYEQIPDYGHLPPRFVPRVVRAEWAWIPTSRAAATDALVVC